MGLLKYIILFEIVMIILAIILFIAIIIIAVNSIKISKSLNNIHDKLIDIDITNQNSTIEICSEIRNITKR